MTQDERKQLRRKKAEKREKNQKRLLICLGIAAGILLLSIILILVLTGGEDSPEEAPIQQAGEGMEYNDDTVHIVFGGDVNVTDAVVASGGAALDYTRTFMDVGHLFGGADLAVVNLEGILYGAPYGEEGRGSAPQQMMEALNRSGVDLVQAANSFSLNRGVSGLQMTLDGIRAAGMEPVGAYATSSEAKKSGGYVLCDVEGVQVAFMAFTKGMSGYSLPQESAGCVNVLYTDYNDNYQKVDTEGIKKVISAAEQSGADLTIALVHWGSEYNDTISESQEEILELMQANGVDAVIGTHAHRVQQMVFDKQKGTFVAYCLGDLIGDAPRAGSEYSVLLDLQITKSGEDGPKISGYSYTPIYTVREEGKPVRVLRIEEAIQAYENHYIEAVSEATYNSMLSAQERISARVKGE